MVTVEPETTSTPSPCLQRNQKSNQEVANPEQYMKHPLRTDGHSGFLKMIKAKLGKSKPSTDL